MQRNHNKRLLGALTVLALLTALLTTVIGAGTAAAVSAVEINPKTGPAGTSVTGTGTEFVAGHHIQVSWETTTPIGSRALVDGTGHFTTTFTVPTDATPGDHNVTFNDIEGRFLLVAVFHVGTTERCPVAGTSATPSTGGRNSKFILKGDQWHPGGRVKIELPYGSPGKFYPRAEPPVDSSGNWQVTQTVGQETPNGHYIFTLTEENVSGCPGDKIVRHRDFDVTGLDRCPSAGTDTTPTHGPRASKFEIKGEKWHPGGRVKIELPYGSPGKFYPRAQPPVDSSGSWQVILTVGQETPNGRYTFILTEENVSGCPGGKIIRHETYTVQGRTPGSPQHCDRVLFIGAHGVGESSTGTETTSIPLNATMVHFLKKLRVDHRGKARQYMVPYKKIEWWEMWQVIRGNQSPINEGASMLNAEVKRFRTECGRKGHVVLVGYSEGAWIVAESLRRMVEKRDINIDVLDTVLGVQLYGDPLWDVKDQGKGLAARAGFGKVFGSYPYPPILNDLSRMRTSCNPGDPVCGRGYKGDPIKGLKECIRKGTCLDFFGPHLAYDREEAKKGGEFLASKVPVASAFQHRPTLKPLADPASRGRPSPR